VQTNINITNEIKKAIAQLNVFNLGNGPQCGLPSKQYADLFIFY